jgi:hypothetical protein
VRPLTAPLAQGRSTGPYLHKYSKYEVLRTVCSHRDRAPPWASRPCGWRQRNSWWRLKTSRRHLLSRKEERKYPCIFMAFSPRLLRLYSPCPISARSARSRAMHVPHHDKYCAVTSINQSIDLFIQWLVARTSACRSPLISHFARQVRQISPRDSLVSAYWYGDLARRTFLSRRPADKLLKGDDYPEHRSRPLALRRA